jgi:hypothetical protein
MLGGLLGDFLPSIRESVKNAGSHMTKRKEKNLTEATLRTPRRLTTLQSSIMSTTPSI